MAGAMPLNPKPFLNGLTGSVPYQNILLTGIISFFSSWFYTIAKAVNLRKVGIPYCYKITELAMEKWY
jgi:hypothetical protein